MLTLGLSVQHEVILTVLAATCAAVILGYRTFKNKHRQDEPTTPVLEKGVSSGLGKSVVQRTLGSAYLMTIHRILQLKRVKLEEWTPLDFEFPAISPCEKLLADREKAYADRLKV